MFPNALTATQHPALAVLATLLSLSVGSCGRTQPGPTLADASQNNPEMPPPPRPTRVHLPLPSLPLNADQACAECHPVITSQWLMHGMADTLGRLDLQRMPAVADSHWLRNAQSGFAYRVQASAKSTDGSWFLEAWREAPAAGWPEFQRRLPLRFRIGAGVNAMSFVAQSAQRWFFAPLEYYTRQGWEAAPQEFGSHPGGLHHGITGACLACHSDTPVPNTYPLNALGDFKPDPLSCLTCHGPGAKHVARMRKEDVFGQNLDIVFPGDLSPSLQLDLCARCHLEGDARIDFDLALPHPRPGQALSDHRAVMVAREASSDFSFVSQVRRLALSRCFQESPNMTCSSCHNPHLPPRFQGSQGRQQGCLHCHPGVEKHGNPQPGEDCISCHMPRRQPYDLQHVQIAEHRIGIYPSKMPVAATKIRSLESPDGMWEVFRYRRSDPQPYRHEELQALQAMTLAEKGLRARALALFDTLPAPGTPTAWPLEKALKRPSILRLPQFHFLRGRTLAAAGRVEEAAIAYRDALLLAPDLAEAAINLAWLEIDAGHLKSAENQAKKVVKQYPRAEAPWNVLFLLASKRGDIAALERAATESLQRQPDQPRILQALGRIHLQAGHIQAAHDRFAAAYALNPNLAGLLEDIGKVGARMH